MPLRRLCSSQEKKKTHCSHSPGTTGAKGAEEEDGHGSLRYFETVQVLGDTHFSCTTAASMLSAGSDDDDDGRLLVVGEEEDFLEQASAGGFFQLRKFWTW